MSDKLKNVCAQAEPEKEPEAEPLQDLDLDAIIAIEDLPLLPVDVPEWNGRVYIRTLTGAERDKFIDMVTKRNQGKAIAVSGITTCLLSMAMADKDGNRLCKTIQDDAKLNRKGAPALERLFIIARDHNKLKDDIEEQAENS